MFSSTKPEAEYSFRKSATDDIDLDVKERERLAVQKWERFGSARNASARRA
jgi:hypothetical protein